VTKGDLSRHHRLRRPLGERQREYCEPHNSSGYLESEDCSGFSDESGIYGWGQSALEGPSEGVAAQAPMIGVPGFAPVPGRPENLGQDFSLLIPPGGLTPPAAQITPRQANRPNHYGLSCALNYQGVAEDPVDKAVEEQARLLPRHLASVLTINKIRSLEYEFDGQRVNLSWRPSPGGGGEVFASRPGDAGRHAEPVAGYMRQVAEFAYGVHSGGTAAANVPKHLRLSFPTPAGREDSKDMNQDPRFKAMQLAKKQAILRERAAEEWRQNLFAEVAPTSTGLRSPRSPAAVSAVSQKQGSQQQLQPSYQPPPQQKQASGGAIRWGGAVSPQPGGALTGRQSPMRGTAQSAAAAPGSARPQRAHGVVGAGQWNAASGAVRASLSSGYGSAAVLPPQPSLPGDVPSAAAVSAAFGSAAVLPAPATARTHAVRGRSPSPMPRAPSNSGEHSLLHAAPELPRAMSSLHEQPGLSWPRATSPLPGGRTLLAGTAGNLSPQPPPAGTPYVTAHRVSLSPDTRGAAVPAVQSYQPPTATFRPHSPAPCGASVSNVRTSFGGGRASLGGAGTSARASFGSPVTVMPDQSMVN